MKHTFSRATIEAIQSYVYALADDQDRIFYVGKGEGNRVFDHIEEVRRHLKENKKFKSIDPIEDQDDADSPLSPKQEIIAEMLQRKKEPKKYIIREGLTPDQALLIEATLISVLEWQFGGALTNQIAGHGTAHFGLKTVEELEATKGKPFCIDHLPCLEEGAEVVAINVNRRWAEVVNGTKTLIEIAEGCWKINVARARQCKYAIIHANGIVRGVFKIESWSDRDEDGRYTFRPQDRTPLKGPEFSQRNASSLFGAAGNGAQNPIRYVMKPINKNKS